MDDIQGMVEAAQSQEVFNFAEVVRGRGYPKDEVVLYMDEAVAYEIKKLEESLAGEQDHTKLERGADMLDELRKQLAESKVTFKVRGISTKTREDLLEKAREDIKPEYDQHKNFITGQIEKVEKESPKRDRHFTNLLWQAMTEQIIGPNGASKTPTYEDIEVLREAPISQQIKFQRALEKLNVASEAFEAATDDDF